MDDDYEAQCMKWQDYQRDQDNSIKDEDAQYKLLAFGAMDHLRRDNETDRITKIDHKYNTTSFSEFYK